MDKDTINRVVRDFITAIESKDTSSFVNMMSPDGTFIFGNNPPVTGHPAITELIDQMHAALSSTQHEVVSVDLVNDNMILWRGNSVHTRKDGFEARFPHCNTLIMEGDKVKEYQVYVNVEFCAKVECPE